MTFSLLGIPRIADCLLRNENLGSSFLVRRLILAWDPTYTKVTPSEATAMNKADASGYIDAEDIDWKGGRDTRR